MLAAKEVNEQNCAEVVIPHPTCCVTSNWLKVGDYVEFALCVLNFIGVICTDWKLRVVLIFFNVFCKTAAARKATFSQGHFITGVVMSHLKFDR